MSATFPRTNKAFLAVPNLNGRNGAIIEHRPSGQLVLLGERENRRFVVELHGHRRTVQVAPYTVLLELVAAMFEREDGLLDARELVTAAGDPCYARILVSRVNRQVGRIVETSWGQFRIALPKSSVIVCKRVFHVPRSLINPFALDALAMWCSKDV